jgi:hypothetical protein
MRRIAVVLLALALLALAFWLFRPARPASQVAAAPTAAALGPALQGPIAGNGSCAGRSCHGGIDPAQEPGARLLMNEHTTWVRDDPHAGAYASLLNEQSKVIVNRLGIGAAHESARCLSCHAAPEIAAAPQEFPDAEFVKRERALGVGCESCHGNARQWIDPHVGAAWKQTSLDEKQKLGMADVADGAALAQRCAGCHVGAPPTAEAPVARDVNHDLIAAGHPRLTFEFSAYFANLPAHWKRTNFPEVQRWATGQLVAADAALKLLQYRAQDVEGKHDPRVWPEFAEYDCFGCHHDLTNASWRQKREPRPGRRRDALTWGSWYFPMPRRIAGKELAGLAALADLMETPLPTHAAVRARVVPALLDLQNLKNAVAGWDNSTKSAREKRDSLIATRPQEQELSWDVAEQTYLSLCALNRAANDPAFKARLTALLDARAFKAGLAGPSSRPRDGFVPWVFFETLRGDRKK